MELGGYVSVGTWGTGTLTVSGGTLTTTAIKAGGGTGTVTLSGGTVVAAADGTFIPASEKLTVTVSGNATLDTNGKTITIDAAMLGDGTLTCVGGGTVTFTSLDSTCNIVADGATVNKPEAYYWIGGASGDWNDGNNWSRSNDGAAAGAYPSTLTDTVVVGTPATLNLTDNVVVHEVIASAEVVLTGGKSLGFVTMRGDGLVTMSNVTFTISGEASTPFVINSNISIANGTENTFACSTLKNYLYGNLYGSGFLGVYSGSNNTSGGLVFCGDNSGFSGELDCYDNNSPMNETGFSSDAASSANAVWKIKSRSSNKRASGVYQDNINETSFLQTGGYYKFGALNGYLQTGDAGPMTIEVGARDDVACSVTYRGRGTTSKGNTRYVNIVKVGTNVFTVVNDTSYVNNFGDITIKGGVLSLPGVPNYGSFVTFAGEGATLRPTSGELDFSARIKNSTSAIIIDDSLSGYSTWDTALDSSNKGGLIKDGYGTLTLTKVPQYSGATVVKDGKLVVPFGTALSTLELGVNATVEVDMKDAAANATAFSVGKIVGDKSKISLVNNTSGVEFTLVETATGLVYVNGSRSFTWVGPTVIDETTDSSWSNPANWGSESDIPTSADTVTIPAGKEVYVDVDASVLAITATGDVTIKGPSNPKTSLAATSFVGSGSLTVSENVALSIGVMDVDGKITMTQSNIDSNSYADNLADANVGNMDIKNGFSGSGALINNGTLELTGTDTFIGTIGGGQSVTKKGNDTYMLIGNNTFTGGLAIEQGTLKLGSPKDIADVRMDFDASDADSFTVDEATGYVTAWKDQINDLSFNYASGQHATLSTSFFGGKNAFSMTDTEETVADGTRRVTNYKLSESNKDRRSKMMFIAYQASLASEAYRSIYTEDQQRNFRVHIRGNDSAHYWCWHNGGSKNQITSGFYMNDVYGNGLVTQNPQVLGVADSLIRNKTGGSAQCYEVLGSYAETAECFKGGIGEIISYNRNLTHAERKAVDAYLMAKWGAGSATYNVIPAEADVTMKSGATLDMGGLTQEVKSFTGAGTVANGSLKTTGDLTVDGGTLTIQATTGQTYVLSDVEAERLVLTGDAKGYTIKVPDNGRIVGRFVVPAGISVGFEGEGADVTVVNAPKGWEITGKPVAGGILYRVGSFPFVLKLR